MFREIYGCLERYMGGGAKQLSRDMIRFAAITCTCIYSIHFFFNLNLFCQAYNKEHNTLQ